jgi:hypothetical protein
MMKSPSVPHLKKTRSLSAPHLKKTGEYPLAPLDLCETFPGECPLDPCEMILGNCETFPGEELVLR